VGGQKSIVQGLVGLLPSYSAIGFKKDVTRPVGHTNACELGMDINGEP
jgi:hypothetical protein